MLDDNGGWFFELGGDEVSGVQVEEVVVRQVFAVPLNSTSE